MNRTKVALACAAVGLLVACEGAEVRRLLDKDATPDGTADVETDVTPVTPELEFWLVGRGGDLGREASSVELVAEDEPEGYLGFPGFQIDVQVEALGVASGEEVRLFVDGTLVSALAASVATAEGDVASVRFPSVTIPDLGTPVVVRVETRDAEGGALALEKSVGFKAIACELLVQFALDSNRCVEVGTFGATVFVTRQSGTCDRASAVVTVDGSSETLESRSFDEAGELFFPVDLGEEPGEGLIEVAVSAFEGETLRGEGSATGRYDAVAPVVAIENPAEGRTVTVLDDADEDPSNGLQYEVVVEVALDEGESVVLALTVGERPPVELTVTASGSATFPAVTLDESGLVAFRVVATDGCGNASEAGREVLVLAEEGLLVITAPAAGAVLLAADDLDEATATAYETFFEVTTTAVGVGTTLSVECRPVGGDGEWAVVGSELVAEGEVSPSGVYQVAVVVDVGGGAEQECRAVVDLPEPVESEVVAVTFGIPPGALSVTGPTDGACVTSAVVTVSGLAPDSIGELVTLGGSGPGGALAPVELAVVADEPEAGVWTGTWTPEDDGAHVLVVESRDRFGNPLAAAPVAVTVDRLPPGLSFVSPAVTVNGTSDPDEDPAQAGYQMDAVIAVSEATSVEGGQVCLTVNGASLPCQPMAAEVTFAGITLVPGANVVRASGQDGCGNAAPSVTRTVTLVFDNAIEIVAPVAGVTLLARDDQDAATALVYETSFELRAAEAQAGATLVVECRSGPGASFVPVGSRVIGTPSVDGLYDVSVAIDTATLGTAVQCRARVDLPSPSESEVIGLTVGLPAPSALIASPVAGACVNEDIPVSGSASGLDGRALTVALVAAGGGAVASGEVFVGAGAWSGLVELGETADGEYALTVEGTDAFGNALADGAPPVVPVSVDRTLPVVAFGAPLGFVVEEEDSDPEAPGVQVDVEVLLQDEQAAGGEVCLSLGGAALGCEEAGGASVVFAGVTLQPGANMLSAIGRDACGNASAPVDNEVVLLGPSPVVTITTPATDLVTTLRSTTFVVTVADPEDGAPLSGLTVLLYRDEELVAVSAEDNGDGTYTFSAVPLTGGTTATYVAVAISESSFGTSGPRVVTQKGVQPTIAVTAPADGAVLTLASSFCTSPGATCVGEVRAVTTNAEDGSAASLTVECGGVFQLYSGEVAGGAVGFVGVALAHGAVCTLVPAVVDLASQEATGPTVTVVVDRVAPTVAIVSPGGTLFASSDTDPETPGVQAPLTVNVGGVAAGAVVTATLTFEGAARVLTALVASDVPEGESVAIGFEEVEGSGVVTWPSGVVSVQVSVSDAAGNPGSASRLVSVLGEATVRITSPTTATAETCTTTCAAGAVCGAGTCWIAWGVNSSRSLIASVTGLETASDNVRVCSDDPALAGEGEIVCDSAPSAVGPYREVVRGSAANGINVIDLSAALDDGYHRVVVEVLPLEGGGWLSSKAAALATEREKRLFVDLEVPVVTSISSPSDTLEPLGTLNAAEQKAVPRVFEIRFATDEAGRAETHVNGSIVDTRNVPAGETTIDVTLPEGSPQVWVVMQDSVGNRSPATPGLGATTYQPIVDVTAPTLTFSRPNTSPLRAGDNLDVVLASNAEGQLVTLFDAGVEVGTATVTNGVATFAHAEFGVLSDGEHTLTATVSDAAGNASTAATSPATVLVDTVPPVGTILEPEDPSQLTELSDSSADPGFQVAVRFSTGQGATSWSLWTARNCNFSFQNCEAPVQRAVGSVVNPGGEEPVVDVTLDLTSAFTQHKIILQTVDAVGNVHTTEARVQVIVLTCALSFQNLPPSGWYNATACATPPSCASADVTVQVGLVGLCVATRIALFDNGVEVASVDNPGSGASFPITVADGVGLSLEGRAFNNTSQIASTGVVPLGVDLVPPVVDFVATTVAGFLTPAADESVLWTADDDLDGNASGMQFHAAVRVSDANVTGGAITVLTATAGGGPVGLSPSNGAIPLSLSGDSPLTQPLFDLTLTDGAEHDVLVVVRDAAGNTDSSTFSAIVDVTRPATVEITSASVERRRPRVSLEWTAVGDDGVTGLPAGYEVRYSSFPLTEDNWASACDASAIFGSDVIPAPAPAGQTMAAGFGGPDTRPFTDACKFEVIFADGEGASTPIVFMGVRAVDELGNLSPLGSQSLKTVTRGEIENRVKRVRFSNANGAFGSADTNFLSRRGGFIGDINDDGIADWATSCPSPAASQSFCVFLGREEQPDEVVVDSLSGPDHTCLMGSGAGVLFAGATQTGHFVRPLGDVNGDGIDDFGVTGKLSNGATNQPSEGYAVIYFGRAGQLPDLASPNIRIRGLRALSLGTEYIGLCGPGDFDGTVRDGVLADDIAIGEPFASRVHVIPGRGSWTASTNLTINLASTFPTPSDTPLVDLGAWTVETSGVWGITAGQPAGSPPQFGVRCGSAGDVLPTPSGLGTGAKSDLFVYQAGSLDSRIFVFPGREFASRTVVTVTECVSEGCVESPPNVVTDEDQRSVRLRQDSDALRTGFGAGIQGGVDVSGDGVADLIATNPSRSPDFPSGSPDGKAIFIFDGSKLAALIGQDVRVGSTGAPVGESWVGPNGWVQRSSVFGQPLAVRSVGDFDGWLGAGPGAPTLDLAIGNRTGTAVYLRLNHERPGLGIGRGQFPAVDGELVNPYSAATNSLGEWVDGGFDLTGDGLTDFLTGARTGDILITH